MTLTSEAFEWPHAVQRISMLLLVLGLPFVTTFAWYRGERATKQISKAELSIIAILLVIGSFLFYVFARPSEEVAAEPKPAVQQASVAAGTGTPAGISIAVLPFVNLSGDASQEFFSDGMTEEITSALAKVSGLNVVARTSAFQFKGDNRDVQSIAQMLHATHLIEGSVRKDGSEVRITAQLIRADNGTHLWTESFNRELKGVFAVQEEIATAIAASLRLPLGLKPGDTLVRNRTDDGKFYEQYLRARSLFLFRSFDTGYDQAVTSLESLTARDPGFAPAWALLARAYNAASATSPAPNSGAPEEARRADA